MKTIYLDAAVFTGQLPLQEAFSVENGILTQVGSNAELMAQYRPEDRLVRLEGKFVVPGFIDSHMHLLNYGSSLEQCDLSQCTGSLQALRKGLDDFIRSQAIPAGSWVRGRGWNQDYFTDGRRIPTRQDLDLVTREHPVCIVRCCGHCLVVNSLALELLGLDSSLPQPEGGSYDVDASGQMTGVFRDTAMSLIYTRLPAPGREDIKRMLLHAQRRLNTLGITGCHSDDLCAFENVPWQEILAAYRELEESGGLTLRVWEQSQFTDTRSLQEFFDAGYTTGTGLQRFRIGPLKMLGDGSLGARTAFLSRPYADCPEEQGIPIFSQQEFDDMITLARKHRMQVAIHAIGDGILDRILSGYRKAFLAYPEEDHRCGIVHCQITRPDQLEAMKQLGLHIYAQSVFLDYDSRIVLDRVGPELAASSYAFATLQAMGLHVSNGTDCPVETPDPMRGLQCAVTRQPLDGSLPPYRPEEAMTLEQALRSYTWEGAWASFEENSRGSLEPGKAADFAVLSENPFLVPADRICQIRVLSTWLDGQCIYRAE